MKLDRKRISGISLAAMLAAMLAVSGVGAAVASAEEATDPDKSGIEVEGLGGHADPDGVDVDNQNEGEE